MNNLMQLYYHTPHGPHVRPNHPARQGASLCWTSISHSKTWSRMEAAEPNAIDGISPLRRHVHIRPPPSFLTYTSDGNTMHAIGTIVVQ